MIVGGLLALLAIGASADLAGETADAARPAPTDYETIVIQANELGRTLAETSSSVAIFTESELRAATELDFKELLARVANVRVNPVDDRITIRGMNDLGFGGVGRNTSMIVDGAVYSPYWTAFSTYPLWDLTQLEVLRGPQVSASVVSPTGTIALTTRRPTFESDGALQIDVTNESRQEVGAAYGNAIIDDVLAFRVALDARRDDGLIENVTRDDDSWNDEERYLVRGQLLWRPSQWTDAEVRFEYQHAKDDLGAPNGRINQVLAADGYDPYDRKTAIDVNEQVDQHFDVFTLAAEHPLGEDWHATYIASYQSSNAKAVSDYDGTALPYARFQTAANSKLYTADLHVNHDGPWNLQGGLYYIKLDPNFRGHLSVPFGLEVDGESIPPVDLTAQFEFIDQTYATSAFVFASHTWLDRWTTDIGARFVDLSGNSRRLVTYSRGSTTGDPDIDAIYDAVIGSIDTTDDRNHAHDIYTLPTAVVSFVIAPELTAGVRYEQGYRIGQTDVNSFRHSAVPYRPETSATYEVFVRGQWLDGRVAMNMNVFETDYEDMQLVKCLSGFEGDCNVVNVASGNTKGMELELSFVPAQDWSTWLSYGIVDTQYDEILGQFVESPTDAARNDETPWELSTGINFDRGAGVYAHVDVTYQHAAAVALTSSNAVSTEAVTLANMRLGWHFPSHEGLDWDVALYARNLFDEEYLLGVDPASETGGFFQEAFVGEPRVLGLTVRTDW